MGVYRAAENPIIRPEDVKPSRRDFEVMGVFNAGVARLGAEVILLLRVAERPIPRGADVVLCPIYDLGTAGIIVRPFARSTDGIHFQIADVPALAPANRYETFGIEDPRITCLDGTYCIQYVGVAPLGVTTCLASTRDFESFERRGVIFHPDNKDVAIFPARVGDRRYALHRPHSSLFLRNDVWLAESPDLLCWGNHRHLLATRDGMWDEVRIGAGAVPVRLDEGWLEIYHGADRNNRYCLGALLLDGEQPWKVLARSDRPLFAPEAEYERTGFFGDVVFACGLLCEEGRLKVYHGAADTSLCYAEIPLPDVHRNLNL